jgi:predicted RNA binding protein YcfA (HicA-like mRNA interferase family)
MKVRDVIKRLEQNGWRLARTKGIRQWTFLPER